MTDSTDSSHHGLAHIAAEITGAEERLAAVERERAGLVARLTSLRAQRAAAEADARRAPGPVPVDASSRAAMRPAGR